MRDPYLAEMTPIMAQSNIPTVPPYERDQNCNKWLRGLSYYFAANKITNAEQKNATLLHVLGMKIQDVFETLTAVEVENGSDAYKEACLRLKRYHQSKANTVFERYMLREMRQDDESVVQFVSRLQKCHGI